MLEYSDRLELTVVMCGYTLRTWGELGGVGVPGWDGTTASTHMFYYGKIVTQLSSIVF